VIAIKLLQIFFQRQFGQIEGDEVFNLFMHTFAGLGFNIPKTEKQEIAFQRAWISKKVDRDWEVYHRDVQTEKHGDVTVYEPDQEVIGELTEEVLQTLKVYTVEGTKVEGTFDKFKILKKSKHLGYNEIAKRLRISENDVKNRVREERDWLKKRDQREQERKELFDVDIEDMTRAELDELYEKQNEFLKRDGSPFLTWTLVEMVEAMKDVRWKPKFLKKRFERDSEESRKQALIENKRQQEELVKNQRESLRKDGLSEERIEALYRAKDEIQLQELKENEKQLKNN
jgi:DNA-binding Lrp family transcriptional regulator